MDEERTPLALVTGASSGVGLAVAEGLARAGHVVLVASRDHARAERAAARVRAAAPHAPDPRPVVLDLADPASVRGLAAAIASGPLDLLVNNAGLVGGRAAGAWGAGAAMGVNHLGHFALTGLLMPALLRRPGARVVTVTSVVHRRGRIDPARPLPPPGRGRAWPAYRASKLANLVFAVELERRCAEAGLPLVSVAAHPGLARTALGRPGAGPAGLALAVLLRLRGQTADGGALPVLLAATDPDVVPGGLYGPGGPGGLAGPPALEVPAPRALDPALGRSLWDASERLTGVRYPRTAG